MLISLCCIEIGRCLLGVVYRFFFVEMNFFDNVLNIGRECKRRNFLVFGDSGWILVRKDFKCCFFFGDILFCIILMNFLIVILEEEIIIVCKIFWMDGGFRNEFSKVGCWLIKVGYLFMIINLSFFKIFVNVLLR